MHTFLGLLGDNVGPLRHVQTVQELPDILVPDAADLLDVGGALRYVLERVAGDLQLILDVLGCLDVDALVHDDPADELLAQEVPVTSCQQSPPGIPCVQSSPDLDLVQTGLLVLVDVDVDGEMCVDVAHLVLVALGDADDHVVDDAADGAEGSDGLARAVVQLDRDDILRRVAE